MNETDRPTPMRSLEFLERLHEVLAPPTYLEIGVRHGDSLTLARSPAIAIDPRMRPKRTVPEDAQLFEETSDAYFAREDPLEPFGGRPASLAFIDGMHLSEFALRDFINVERHAHWTSVVVFDDVMPRRVDEARRADAAPGGSWTGDVFKLVDVLSRHRPDLTLLQVDTLPTGLLLVLGCDPQSTALSESYPEIEAELDTPNPQEVPTAVLERDGALEPERVLSAPLWRNLREAREEGVARERGLRRLEADARGLSSGGSLTRRLLAPLRRSG